MEPQNVLHELPNARPKSEMDKLVITVTVDSTMSFPNNPHCPPIEAVDEVAEEYVDAVDAGASITHIHGVHHLEDEMQEDGRKLSKIDFDGWQELHDRIKEGCDVDPIMQYGIASARLEEKIQLMDQDPDMMSYAFNAHDEYFHPHPDYEPNELYAIHPRDELREFLEACLEKDVKPEVEAFHPGALYNLVKLHEEGVIEEPFYSTLFFGWPGGAWTPPTPKAFVNFVDHLPANTNWNVSCMDPVTHWDMLTLSIMLGGHVRVGWEDNPYLNPNDLSEEGIATSNAQLVEKIASISRALGREVATPDEAREILGL